MNKYIAESGLCSRRNAEKYILEGRVTINNKTVTDLSYKINEENDEVFVDGEKIKPKRHIYILLNKPKGVITSTKDEKNRKTVVDLVKTNEKIYPVGRLDYNTTGVLLLTNDGDFSNLLTHPKHKIRKTYTIQLNKPLMNEDENKLLKGVYINRRKGIFIKINFPNIKKKTLVEVAVVEGRNHFIKDMFSTLGYNVVELDRKYFGQFEADIPLGKYRVISNEEIKSVYKNYN
ncbi:MAG: rRNA pseudouridine synthase [Bacteroidetes bacterium]|nr:rRNA pseudouridine synthase [Bacteroidota bacterium]MCH8941567.1 rRNA pseudouridine synthase [Bacteroidota bacterium]